MLMFLVYYMIICFFQDIGGMLNAIAVIVVLTVFPNYTIQNIVFFRLLH